MADDRQAVLAAFAGLRVADVRDGMDTMGFHKVGSMSPSIRPLWRTRALGVALTVRYLPQQGRCPDVPAEKYMDWAGRYYRDVCPYPWMAELQPGDFVVIDASGVDAGLMGSENTLCGLRRGAAGFVTSGGVRDTDEIIRQKVPFWSAMVSQSMVQCRLAYDAHNVPLAVGGAAVRPGDVVVADGDGVIVVPRAAALDVARFAAAEHARDRKNRRKHYDALGMAPDETVA